MALHSLSTFLAKPLPPLFDSMIAHPTLFFVSICAVAGSVVLLNVGKSIVDKIKAEKEAEKTNMLI